MSSKQHIQQAWLRGLFSAARPAVGVVLSNLDNKDMQMQRGANPGATGQYVLLAGCFQRGLHTAGHAL